MTMMKINTLGLGLRLHRLFISHTVYTDPGEKLAPLCCMTMSIERFAQRKRNFISGAGGGSVLGLELRVFPCPGSRTCSSHHVGAHLLLLPRSRPLSPCLATYDQFHLYLPSCRSTSSNFPFPCTLSTVVRNYSVRPSAPSDVNQNEESEQDDFFGIEEYSAFLRKNKSEDYNNSTRNENGVAGTVPPREFSHKNEFNQGSDSRKNEMYDKIVGLPYGMVRLDKLNQPKKSVQVTDDKILRYGKVLPGDHKIAADLHEPEMVDSQTKLSDKSAAEAGDASSSFGSVSNIFDEQYFEYGCSAVPDQEKLPDTRRRDWKNRIGRMDPKSDLNYFDQVLFGLKEGDDIPCTFDKSTDHNGVNMHDMQRPTVSDMKESPESAEMNYIDQQLFGIETEIDNSATENLELKYGNSGSEKHSENTTVSGNEGSERAKASLEDSSQHYFDEADFEMPKFIHGVSPATEYEPEPKLQISSASAESGRFQHDVEFHEPVTNQRKKLTRLKANTDKPQTAYDMAMKIRKEEAGKKFVGGARFVGDVDSKGFRILKNQVPDLSQITESAVVRVLKDSIIYNQNDIVAIDKPYGLPSQGGPGVQHSISGLLPKLAEKLNPPAEALHMVHRLDKETTGVMLLAKTNEMKLKLQGLFKNREIIKRYWVITKGIPPLEQGVIEIPIAETSVNGSFRMTLRPEPTEKTKNLGTIKKKKSGEVFYARTKYRILDKQDACALLECETHTGIKHQLRCHLSFGLNTPILGDHKYSHFTKIAPQRLFSSMLQRLGIRQSKVRHVPMHLHAKQVLLPYILEGKSLHLGARLPKHFVTNMRRLGLKIPQ